MTDDTTKISIVCSIILFILVCCYNFAPADDGEDGHFPLSNTSSICKIWNSPDPKDGYRLYNCSNFLESMGVPDVPSNPQMLCTHDGIITLVPYLMIDQNSTYSIEYTGNHSTVHTEKAWALYINSGKEKHVITWCGAK